MKVLIVEPLKPCYVREIEGLQAMQEIVGGHIEAIYPYEEPVAIIANEEAKLLGLPFNRPLLDEHGVPYDIVCGTFFLTGLGEETFVSLTDDQIQRYKELFDSRMVLTVSAKTQEEKLYFAYGMNVNLKRWRTFARMPMLWVPLFLRTMSCYFAAIPLETAWRPLREKLEARCMASYGESHGRARTVWIPMRDIRIYTINSRSWCMI